ncbi:MAG: hypothetical protein ACTSQJ_04685 [Promethearchaeota archaeon]
MVKAGKKILHFYNNNGSLEQIIKFLESVQKKVNYINLSIRVDGCKDVKIIVFGPRDLQYLAIDKIRSLAREFF